MLHYFGVADRGGKKWINWVVRPYCICSAIRKSGCVLTLLRYGFLFMLCVIWGYVYLSQYLLTIPCQLMRMTFVSWQKYIDGGRSKKTTALHKTPRKSAQQVRPGRGQGWNGQFSLSVGWGQTQGQATPTPEEPISLSWRGYHRWIRHPQF